MKQQNFHENFKFIKNDYGSLNLILNSFQLVVLFISEI